MLDVFSNEDKFGKKSGGDIITNKKTFLYLKAFELAQGKTYDSLWFCFNKKFENNLKKVKGVKKIYEELNIREITEKEMNKYYEKAIIYLESISVDNSQKNELKKFAEKLMIREY